MAVKLIPIEQADFESFMKHDITAYAEVKVKSGIWRPEGAIEQSRQEHMQLLPDGRQTRGHFIYSVFDDATRQKVGVLWVNVKSDQPHPEAFIYDIEIEEPFRGKGYGRQALTALDELLIGMGVEHVDLHVFGYN